MSRFLIRFWSAFVLLIAIGTYATAWYLLIHKAYQSAFFAIGTAAVLWFVGLSKGAIALRREYDGRG